MVLEEMCRECVCISHSTESKRSKNNVLYAVIGENYIFIIFGHSNFAFLLRTGSL